MGCCFLRLDIFFLVFTCCGRKRFYRNTAIIVGQPVIHHLYSSGTNSMRDPVSISASTFGLIFRFLH
jgi:hypothetical protein